MPQLDRPVRTSRLPTRFRGEEAPAEEAGDDEASVVQRGRTRRTAAGSTNNDAVAAASDEVLAAAGEEVSVFGEEVTAAGEAIVTAGQQPPVIDPSAEQVPVAAEGRAAEGDGGVTQDEQVVAETTEPIDKILNAKWGEMHGTDIRVSVESAYQRVSRWKRNIFYLPTGKAGESFIEELTKVINQFNNNSPFESVALMMVTIMFPLILQKPSKNSKSKDHIRFLEKRLELWKNGQLSKLVNEGMAIQKRMSNKKKPKAVSNEERFIRLMEQGKISAALRCIGSLQCGVHEITPEVLAELREKHPEPRDIQIESLHRGPQREVEDVIYENIDANAIHMAAKKVNGAAGPSGADSDMWQRLLCSKQHKKKPAELCQAVADLARKLNRQRVPASYLQAFVAGRLIPLDKNPGVRPIGIGEVLRRIISSATVTLLKPELVSTTAPLQTCAGLSGGIEGAIHAMRRMFEDEETEAVLLVDASNAFNALNRKAALHNVKYTCPELSTFLHNIYQSDAELFLPNTEEVIYSREGTTQGGPESMAFYAASTTSLLNSQSADSAKRVFYADDGSGASKLVKLSEWWQELKVIGPPLGYDVNAGKSWLIAKPEYIDQARELFPDIRNITVDGHEFLGSFIGTTDATDMFVKKKIDEWERDIDALVKIAASEPQLAYSAYIYGTSRRWQFVCRTTPGVANAMKKLEHLVRTKLIPAIMGGREVADEMRKILQLPARMGGMGFQDPSEESEWEYENSKRVTAQISDAIYQQQCHLEFDEEAQVTIMKDLKKRKVERWNERYDNVMNMLDARMRRVIQLAAEKGASTWLTSIPLKAYGFRLNKQQFQDAVCLRYDLRLKDVPINCACTEEFSVNHCLTCKRGGYVLVRHNAVRDTLAEVLREVCKDVKVEPQLLPVTGEALPAGAITTDGAKSDVSAIGLWHPMNRAFIDVRVFNPHAPSNAAKTLEQMYVTHEQEKKRKYLARILQVEKGTFSPAIFSCSGGASPETTKLLKIIAAKMAMKRRENYNVAINFLRRRISFDILRSCLMSFRGERGPSAEIIEDLDISERVMSY